MATPAAMRIGIITNHYLERVGGAEEALDRLAGHWHEAGHDVVLFSIRSRKARRKRDWRPMYRHVRLPYILSTQYGLGRYVRPMLREHAAEPFDVVLACDAYWAGHVAHRFRKRTGVPYAIWSQGGDVMDTSRFLQKSTPRRRMAETIREADALLPISKYIEACMTALAAPSGLVRPLPNGWPDEWAGIAPTPPVMGGRYVFAMGRLVRLKGFQVLLDAFASIREKHPDVRLVIAGEGAFLPELLAQAANLDLGTGSELDDAGAPPVLFPGFVQGDRKRALIETAAVGVLPSIRNEPMSLALFEMLSRGVPVIASRVGGTPDIVHTGVNGLLVAPDDPAELAAALDRLLSDEAQRQQLAAAAAESVAEYRWSRIAARGAQVLAEIAKRPNEPRP